MDEQFLPAEALRLPPDILRTLIARDDRRAALAVGRVLLQAMVFVGGAAAVPLPYQPFFWPVIGATAHALSILHHEAVHGLLFRSRRLNELAGTLLAAPVGFSMAYRPVHFAHHRFLGTERDPDMVNYGPFPSTKRALLGKVLVEFSGLGAVHQFLSGGSAAGRAWTALVPVVIAQAALAALLTALAGPWGYPMLWLLPLLTFGKGFAQLRNLSEHFLRESAASGTERAHTFRSNPVERFFLAPLHFHFHAEHHWYPMVPFYRLPALRRALQARPAYAEATAIEAGYLPLLMAAYRRSA